ncbi:MAG: FHA domain-containing protein, partial [Myxococcales bacterium]|nr:FHA domain-containing protein [Myxococcales bacterium]
MSTFTLSIQYSDTRSETLQFSGSRFLIGREYGDIVLRDPKVSGRHGELRVSHDGQYLTYSDLNSSNGSYRADGQRIVGTIPLSVGSVIYIGSSSITVLAIGSPRPAAPPPTPAPPRRGSTVVATAASVKSIVAAEVQGVLSGEIGSSSGAAEEEPSDHTPPHGIEVTPVASEPRRGVPRGGTLPPPLTPAPTPA